MWGGGWDVPAAWGGMPDNKTMLVDRVKEWQRMSPAHKRSWDNYCMQKGMAKFDPNKKEEPFLLAFLELAEAGQIPLDDPTGADEDEGEKAALVDQVKQWQRLGQGHKQAWWNYCSGRGTRDFDPNRHDVASLQKFISGCESGTIVPDENAAVEKGSKGSKDSDSMMRMSKGGFGGYGGCGGGCGKGEMMMMMMGMMMKGMMKGGKASAICGCGSGRSSGASQVGEIRYDDALHAQAAIQSLNGSTIQGSTINVAYDQSSMDGTKLIITGVPPGVQWQELKDHFKGVGTVAYAGFKRAPPDAGAWDPWGGGWDPWGGWEDPWGGCGGYGPWCCGGCGTPGRPRVGGKGKGLWGPY